MQRSTQLSLIAFLVTLAALPVSDGLAATSHPTDTTEGTQTVDDRLSKLAVAFEQRARGAENSADLPSEFSSLLAGFVNAGGFRNGGGGGGFINGGGGGGGFANAGGGGGGFANGGGGGGFANFRNY